MTQNFGKVTAGDVNAQFFRPCRGLTRSDERIRLQQYFLEVTRRALALRVIRVQGQVRRELRSEN